METLGFEAWPASAIASRRARELAGFFPNSGAERDVWNVRMIVRVPADKQLEFFQTAHRLLEVDRQLVRSPRVMRDLDDTEVFFWTADAATLTDLVAFIESRDFMALRSAADVLGRLVDLRMLSDGPAIERPS
jgi:hypothetical protein